MEISYGKSLRAFEFKGLPAKVLITERVLNDIKKRGFIKTEKNNIWK